MAVMSFRASTTRPGREEAKATSRRHSISHLALNAVDDGQPEVVRVQSDESCDLTDCRGTLQNENSPPRNAGAARPEDLHLDRQAITYALARDRPEMPSPSNDDGLESSLSKLLPRGTRCVGPSATRETRTGITRAPIMRDAALRDELDVAQGRALDFELQR